MIKILFSKKPIFTELYLKQFIDPIELGQRYITPINSLLQQAGVGYVDGNEYDTAGHAVIVMCIENPTKKHIATLVEIFETLGKKKYIPQESMRFIGEKIYLKLI